MTQESFAVSAPGKVIVFGEHAVVHGRPAIAAAIALRSYLMVTPLENSKIITLDFPDVKMTHSWPIESLPWAAFSHHTKVKKYHDRVVVLDKDLVLVLKPYVDSVSSDLPDQLRKIHQSAASAFLYLLCSLATPDFTACTYTLRSTIPIASGLGSSASISVCLSAALLHQTNRLTLPNSETSEHMLNVINQWAFVGELNIHGNPSGVDNTVATRGKAVMFKRTEYGKNPLVRPLHDFPVVPLLLVDTNQARSTATEVAKVGALKEDHPTITNAILDTIGKITESAHDLISSEKFDPKTDVSLRKFGELVRMNHGQLVSLGVSHPRLERIRELVDHAGIGWTKLTGGGGGGCAFTVLNKDNSTAKLKELEENLIKEGFSRYETLLGGPGVGFIEKGVKEIEQHTFLAAPDGNAVEGMIGISKLDGWHFW